MNCSSDPPSLYARADGIGAVASAAASTSAALTTIPGRCRPAERCRADAASPRAARLSTNAAVREPPPLVEHRQATLSLCWYAPLELHREPSHDRRRKFDSGSQRS